MAEDSDLERTEPASGRRIEQAREKGQVARSRELGTFAILMAGGGGIMIMGAGMMESLKTLLRDGLTLDKAVLADPLLMLARLHEQSQTILTAFMPFLILLFIVALAAPMVMSGWLFTLKALEPDFGKLDPFKGISRLFSTNSLVELVKAVAKSVLIGGVAVWVVWHNKDDLFLLIAEPLQNSIGHLGSMAIFTYMAVTSSIILIVAIDVPFQLWQHSKQLRMTKEELRQEGKEMEGDPQVKARIRSMQREAARRRMMTQVPKADVIVTNPTHFAVALSYQDKKMRAPQVVAKGTYLLAQRICELGRENKVPIVQAPPLARALYRHGELGEEIPGPLYTAVAEVLAYVYQLRRYETEGGAAPRVPEALPVPPAMDPGEVRTQ
jgi:flagellar biosynthetic protein FlhB